MKRSMMVLAACIAVFSATGPALADQLVEEYNAYIGRDDLYNSNGERLREPWQIIRQDRANFHKFRVRQEGDQSDNFFSSVENRAAAERMIRDGAVTRQARQLLLQGDVMINVKIFEGPDGDYIKIAVE